MNATSTRFDPGTYRRATVGLSLLAAIALAAGTVLDRAFLGIGVYVIALGSVFAMPAMAEQPLYDERDDVVMGQASAATLTLIGWASALVYPSLVALSATGHFSWGPASSAIAFATAGLYGTLGLAVLYYRAR